MDSGFFCVCVLANWLCLHILPVWIGTWQTGARVDAPSAPFPQVWGFSRQVPAPGCFRSKLPSALSSTDQANEELEGGKHKAVFTSE